MSNRRELRRQLAEARAQRDLVVERLALTLEAVELCGAPTGVCSNRCLLPLGHKGRCDCQTIRFCPPLYREGWQPWLCEYDWRDSAPVAAESSGPGGTE